MILKNLSILCVETLGHAWHVRKAMPAQLLLRCWKKEGTYSPYVWKLPQTAYFSQHWLTTTSFWPTTPEGEKGTGRSSRQNVGSNTQKWPLKLTPINLKCTEQLVMVVFPQFPKSKSFLFIFPGKKYVSFKNLSHHGKSWRSAAAAKRWKVSPMSLVCLLLTQIVSVQQRPLLPFFFRFSRSFEQVIFVQRAEPLFFLLLVLFRAWISRKIDWLGHFSNFLRISLTLK